MEIGINDHPQGRKDYSGAPGLIAAAHATWARIPVDWFGVQPAAPVGGVASWGRGSTSVGVLRAAYNAASLKVLWTVMNPPSWATGSANQFATPLAPADFAAVMAHLVADHPGQAWELFNEPDGEVYFLPDGAPLINTYGSSYRAQMAGVAGVYAPLVAAAYPAMKEADPTCTVVAGSLAYPNVTFFEACLAAEAKFTRSYDVFSIHTYATATTRPYQPPTWDPTPSIEAGIGTGSGLNAFQAARAAAGDATPLIISEFGWPAYPPAIPPPASPPTVGVVPAATQAGWTACYLAGLAARGDIAVAMIYQLLDTLTASTGVSAADREGFYGICTIDAVPKGAYTALQGFGTPR